MKPAVQWSMGATLFVTVLLAGLGLGEAADRAGQLGALKGLYAGPASGMSETPVGILVVVIADGAGGGTLEITHPSGGGTSVFPMTYTVTPSGRVTLFVNAGGAFGTLEGQIVNKGRSIAFSMLMLTFPTGYDVAGRLEAE